VKKEQNEEVERKNGMVNGTGAVGVVWGVEGGVSIVGNGKVECRGVHRTVVVSGGVWLSGFWRGVPVCGVCGGGCGVWRIVEEFGGR
jgi:hypothetical protein